MDESLFNTRLEPECEYSITYGSFLREIAEQVEYISSFGASVWDSIFLELDIYDENSDSKVHLLTEWIDRTNFDEHRFHLQCSHLCRTEVYKDSDLGRYCYMPDRPGWRKGENQTAEALWDCRSDKYLILALFVYAHLESKVSRSSDYDRYTFVDGPGKKEINPRTNRYTRLVFNTKIMPTQELSRVIASHLKSADIWHHWARTCTSLLPLLGELRETRPLFESYWSFASYLAHKFVLMTGRVAVCKYSYTNKSDPILMKRIKKFVEDNRNKSVTRA